jgi:hypothetical protein
MIGAVGGCTSLLGIDEPRIVGDDGGSWSGVDAGEGDSGSASSGGGGDGGYCETGASAEGSAPAEAGHGKTPSQVWIVYDQGAGRADLDGEMDCLVNGTDFNDIAASYDASPFFGLRAQWAPQAGHGGSMQSAAAGQCGPLYQPNAQCLVNLVMGNQSLGVPAMGDVFLYVVHDGTHPCGGGNNAGVTQGAGEQVQGPQGQTIFVYTATIADGWGDLACQERVAMRELFEALTNVDAAECCAGQTPGNLCEDCSASCAQYVNVGPGGDGSYSLACPSGATYTGQLVEAWCSSAYVNGVWQPAGCTAAH